MATDTVCLTDCKTPPRPNAVPTDDTVFSALSMFLNTSLGTDSLFLDLLMYLFTLSVSILLSSTDGTIDLNDLDLKNESTCLIAPAVFISTSAPVSESMLFTSKSRLTYLPFGRTLGLTDAIITPDSFVSVIASVLIKNAEFLSTRLLSIPWLDPSVVDLYLSGV